MSWDYGNARVAALRSRLPDATAIARLAESSAPAVFVAALERDPEWRGVVREAASLGLDPAGVAYAAIERHRSQRLAALPRMYDGKARRLVEALVLPLDAERLVAILRRRQAGEAPDAIGATIVPGALLDAATLGRIARAASPEAALRLAARSGVILPGDAQAAAASWAAMEEVVVAAVDRARAVRARGWGRDAAFVRRVIAREQADRAAAAEELAASGPATSALIERTGTLTRLDALVAAGRTDPLGVPVVAGYVAAVGATAIRMRVALARVVAGWTADTARPWLARGTERWPASLS